ncbi:hypothetical protein RRG08_060720 [Elysia crispata]|uniref:Uncharacterized protein n=1 Tax=Elysia crispata TaxID=231223 RepID=A0AAE0XNC9_9GAST|nr:hypothetical protein RRG08_060720 [Elysia crispata]
MELTQDERFPLFSKSWRDYPTLARVGDTCYPVSRPETWGTGRRTETPRYGITVCPNDFIDLRPVTYR